MKKKRGSGSYIFIEQSFNLKYYKFIYFFLILVQRKVTLAPLTPFVYPRLFAIKNFHFMKSAKISEIFWNLQIFMKSVNINYRICFAVTFYEFINNVQLEKIIQNPVYFCQLFCMKALYTAFIQKSWVISNQQVPFRDLYK